MIKNIDDFMFVCGRPTDHEVNCRLAKIHQYCKSNPAAKPADIRLELMETNHVIRKYFKLVKEGAFNVV